MLSQDLHDHAGDAGDDAVSDTSPAFVGQLVRVLSEGGAQTIGDLAEVIRSTVPELVDELDDVDLRTTLRAVARSDERLWQLGDGRVAVVAVGADGACFSHLLTEDEVRREVLDGTPDLVGLPDLDAFRLARRGRAEDGATIEVRFADDRAHPDGSLVGPAGWLNGFTPGSLVVVSWSAADGLHVDGARGEPSAAATERHVAFLRAAFALRAAAGPPEPFELVREVLSTERDAFRGELVAPVEELLTAAGLERRGDWVVPIGGDGDDEQAIARARLVEQASRTEGLRACCSSALRVAFGHWTTWLAGSGTLEADEARQAAGALDHGPVVVLLHQTVVLGGEDDGRLSAWADEIARNLEASGREGGLHTVSAGAEYLRARAADAAGDPRLAVQQLETGLVTQPDHVGAQLLLADLLEDCGEIVRPLALLRSAGVPEREARVATLDAFVALARRTGRNDVCPCGSGRKFKACCSSRSAVVTPADRARWLLQRAFRATAEGPAALALVNLRSRLERILPPVLVPAVLADLQLFARGEVATYLTVRKALLPEGDRALLVRWSTEPLRLLNLSPLPRDAPTGRVGAGARVVATDRVRGDAFVVAVDPRSALPVGATVLARLLPTDPTVTGDHIVAGAALVVAAEEQERVAAALGTGSSGTVPGADTLVDLLSSLF